jgi:predicted Zn-dependent protease
VIVITNFPHQQFIPQGAVHEVGHALGLKHTNIKNSVMNPVYKRGVFNGLGDDDIQGIVKLYGLRECFNDHSAFLSLNEPNFQQNK